MVIDLNKCFGCQTCTLICKREWTNRGGREKMYWNHVETIPSCGYPKNWMKMGGGFDENGKLRKSKIPPFSSYRMPWEEEDDMKWGVNWEEETVKESFYFFLPRICNHCSNPACLEVCEKKAIFKREEDGIVLIDETICDGCGECIKACPYKKIYFNDKMFVAQKCNFCYPRIEQNLPPLCAFGCSGRARFVGYLDDESSSVWRLVNEFRVALPLRKDFNTGPNVYYIPIFLSPTNILIQKQQELFGIEVFEAIATLKQENLKKDSQLFNILIGYEFEGLFDI